MYSHCKMNSPLHKPCQCLLREITGTVCDLLWHICFLKAPFVRTPSNLLMVFILIIIFDLFLPIHTNVNFFVYSKHKSQIYNCLK